ncbi:tensin-2-like isoform X2 [Dysidea avara]|uniref:tensin-2-like isoform X2 n=1 Tax=Dysidea avara TaxID=196820 RepID=UPI00332B5FDD
MPSSAMIDFDDDNELGHDFSLTMVKKPRPCNVCSEIIWSDAISCTVCQLVCHTKCEVDITQECVDQDSVQISSRYRVTAPTEAPKPAKGLKNRVKHRVAKGRGRYVDDDVDLDLTYITEKIIAMSFPATGLETTYRNDMKDVAKMLKTKHQDNYMIFNLSERSYDISKFNNQVLDFGWPDHLAPSLERLSSICKSMKSWLDSDSSHVAVVHCKGGKGRTGCVISAFMHYTAVCDSAEDALDRFAMKRFYDRKLGGVTQPSQRKYVYYFSDLLSGKISTNAKPIVLNHVIIHGCPDFDGKGGCRPYLKVYQEMTLVHTTRLHNGPPGSDRIRITLDGGVTVKGELLFKCFHKRTATNSDSIFRVQFHSSVVQDYAISFSKQELDDAFKDKRFPNATKVEFIFSPYKGDVDKKIPDLVRRSLLGSDDLTAELDPELDPELKRNSYEDFLSGFDSGMPDLPSPIKPMRRRSLSLERFPGPKEDLYTTVNKPTRKKPLSASTKMPKGSSYTKLSDINVNKPDQAQQSYSEISIDRRPELEPNKRRESAVDDDMWVTVKWKQQQEQQRSELEQSVEDDPEAVALSLLGGGGQQDAQAPPMMDYSNLEDINSGQVFVGEVKRAEEDSNKIYIEGITDINSDFSIETHDYINHDTDENKTQQQQLQQKSNGKVLSKGDTYSEIEDVEEVVKFLDEKKKQQQQNGLSAVPDTNNYINTEPSHSPTNLKDTSCGDYYNQEVIEDLAAQQHQPHHDEHKENNTGSPEPLQPILRERKSSKGRQFKNLIKNPFSSSSSSNTKLSHIHSSAISDDDKTKSLAVFKLDGVNLASTSVDSFLQDSWTPATSQEHSSKPETKKPDIVKAKAADDHKKLAAPSRPSPPTRFKSFEEPPMKISGGSKHLLELRHSVQPEKTRTPVRRSHSSVAGTGNRVRESEPPVVAPRNQRPISHMPHGTKKPLIPPAPYRKPSGKIHDRNGSANVAAKPFTKPSGVPAHPRSPPMPRKEPRPISPREPESREVSENEVKELEQYWYKPNYTREEAVDIISHAEPGSFIVRDSQSVMRGYALTIKVSEIIIRRKLKVPPDFQVTSDMCVKHFLLQPDSAYPMGIKLQGWNEKPFITLVAFITGHCNDKLCLPCKLVLPSHDLGHVGSGNLSQSLLTSGAACDLVYVGGVDVAGPGSAALLSSAVQQFKALQLNTTNIVNFKATKNGIIITDIVNGMFVKRHYPIKSVSFCAVDASDTRWDFSNVKYKDKIISVHNARCFGFVHRPMEQSTYMCLLFAELDSSEQPVESVVQFVNQLIVLSQT